MKFKDSFDDNCILNDDRGFSLVELIIAVAVLAIVFTPIIRSFLTSTLTNARAQELQNATSLAEKIMENVKGKSIDELETEANAQDSSNGASDNIIFKSSSVNKTDADGNIVTNPGGAPVVLTDSDGKELKNYEIVYKSQTATNGKTFDAVVTIQSSDYAEEKASGVMDVRDANIREIPAFSEIDSYKNAVISWELNRYDGAAFEMILDRTAVFDKSMHWYEDLDDTWEDTGEFEEDGVTPKRNRKKIGIWWAAVDRYRDFFKKCSTVSVRVDTAGSKKTVLVDCDVSYEPNKERANYGDRKDFEPVSYSLFSSQYPVTTEKDESNNDVEVFPDLYIFYTFMRDDEEVITRRENGIKGGNPFLRIHACDEFLDIDIDDAYKGNVFFVLQPRNGEFDGEYGSYELLLDSSTSIMNIKYNTSGKKNDDGELNLYISVDKKNGGGKKISEGDTSFLIGSGTASNSLNFYTNLEHTFTKGADTFVYDGNLYDKKTSDKMYQITVTLYKPEDYKAGDFSKPQAKLTSTMQIK